MLRAFQADRGKAAGPKCRQSLVSAAPSWRKLLWPALELGCGSLCDFQSALCLRGVCICVLRRGLKMNDQTE